MKLKIRIFTAVNTRKSSAVRYRIIATLSLPILLVKKQNNYIKIATLKQIQPAQPANTVKVRL